MPTVNQTKQKINEFAKISVGWHFGEGNPADERTVTLACLLNESLGMSGFFVTDAFLGPGGQIQVNGYRGEHFLELIVDDSYIYFLLENDNYPVVEEKNLDIHNALSRVHFWGTLLWDTLDSSTQDISTTLEESTVTLPSSNQAATADRSPSWIASALARVEEVSANTLGGTIQESEESHLFFLKSPQNTYQLNARS